jgi:hypothetical protein
MTSKRTLEWRIRTLEEENKRLKHYLDESRSWNRVLETNHESSRESSRRNAEGQRKFMEFLVYRSAKWDAERVVEHLEELHKEYESGEW